MKRVYVSLGIYTNFTLRITPCHLGKSLDGKNTNDEIKVVLDELKELEFEITDNDTARNVGGGYVLEIIHNFYMNFDTETGGLITDETGTNYQYAIRLFVDFDGYVYVKDVSNTEESGQRWTDVKDTDIVFKSKTKIDFKKLDDIQKNNI